MNQLAIQMEASKNKFLSSNMQQQQHHHHQHQHQHQHQQEQQQQQRSNTKNKSKSNGSKGILHQNHHPPSPNNANNGNNNNNDNVHAGCMGMNKKGLKLKKLAIIPQCNGSYGRNERKNGSSRTTTTTAETAAAATNSTGPTRHSSPHVAARDARGALSLPDVEDVLRWKEFRRRQRSAAESESSRPTDMGEGAGEGDNNDNSNDDGNDDGTDDDNDRRRREDCHVDDHSYHAQPSMLSGGCGSLSLSLSESTSAPGTPRRGRVNASQSTSPLEEAATTDSHHRSDPRSSRPRSNNCNSHRDGNRSNNVSDIDIGIVTEIDEEGFPAVASASNMSASPASLASEELRAPDGCSAIESRGASFSGGCPDPASRNPISSSEEEKAPTEVASNTARYVARRSNLMARRMMGAEGRGGIDDDDDDDVVLTLDTVGGTNATTATNGTNNGMQGEEPHTSAAATTTRTMLPVTPAGEVTPASSSSSRAGHAPASFDTPGWDSTRTTVDNDQLEAILATPGKAPTDISLAEKRGGGEDTAATAATASLSISMRPTLEPLDEDDDQNEGNGSDDEDNPESTEDSNASNVSSDWNPMHVSTIEEDDDDDEGNNDGSSGEQFYASAVPTLAEVDVFMSHLRQTQQQKTPRKTKGSTSERSECGFSSTYSPRRSVAPRDVVEPHEGTVASPHAPDSPNDNTGLRREEESLRFDRALLEKKERLRRHKLDSDRRRKELNQRRRAMRDRVEQSASFSPGTTTAATTPREEVDDFSFKPPSIAGDAMARQEGDVVRRGRLQFSSSSSSPPSSSPPTAPSSSSPMGTLLASIGNAATSKFRSSGEHGELRNDKSASEGEAEGDRLSSSPSLFAGRPAPANHSDSAGSSSPSTVGFARTRGEPARRSQAALAMPPSPVDAAIPLTSESKLQCDFNDTAHSSDTSVADKGRGTGVGSAFGYTMPDAYIMRNMQYAGDKSIVSKTSSNFVELGLPASASQEDPPCEDLLGVTVKGSKRRKRRTQGVRTRSSQACPFEPLDEIATGCSGDGSSVQEGEAQDCEGPAKPIDGDGDKCAADAVIDNSSSGNSNSNSDNRKPLDPDGIDWKELEESKRKEEESMPRAMQHQLQPKSLPPSSPQPPPSRLPQEQNQMHRQQNFAPTIMSSVEEEEELASERMSDVGVSSDKEFVVEATNEEFIAVMDRAKACLAPQESTIVKSLSADSLRATNVGAVSRSACGSGGSDASKMSQRLGDETKDGATASSVRGLRSKFESSEIGGSASVVSEAKSRIDGVEGSGAAVVERRGSPKRKSTSLAEAPSFQSEGLAKRKNAPSLGVPGSASDKAATAMCKGASRRGASMEARSNSEPEVPKRSTSMDEQSRFESAKVMSSGTRDFSIGRFKKHGMQRQREKMESFNGGGAGAGADFAASGWKNYQAGINLIRSASREEFNKEAAQEHEEQEDQHQQHHHGDVKSKIQSKLSEENKDPGNAGLKSSSDSVSIKELRSRFESSKLPAMSLKQQGPRKPPSTLGSGPWEPPTLTKISIIDKRSSMIGSGIYLRNSNIQAMSSLECETQDTDESSQNKSEANEDNIQDTGNLGCGTFDTKKVLRYAKILERRHNLAEVQEMEHLEENEGKLTPSSETSIEKKDTNASSLKENYHAGGGGDRTLAFPNPNDKVIANAATQDSKDDDDLPHNSSKSFLSKKYSQIKTRKKALEFMKKSSTLNTPERKDTTAAVNSASLSREKDDMQPISASDEVVEAARTNEANNFSKQREATTVRDRIAVFGGKNTAPVKTRGIAQVKKSSTQSPNRPMPQTAQASPIKAATTPRMGVNSKASGGSLKQHEQQQQHKLSEATPPRTAAMNDAMDSLSPLWVVPNRSNGQNGYSPPVGNGNFNNRNRQQLVPIRVNNKNNSTPHAAPIVGGNHWPPSTHNKMLPTRSLTQPPLKSANRGGIRRPMPVQTSYASPNPSDDEDDGDEDGITLSPTFSEVSCLTMPTCIATVNGDASASVKSDIFANLSLLDNKSSLPDYDAMSPIARHRQRQQQEKSSMVAGAKMAKNRYLQRVKSMQSHVISPTQAAAPPINTVDADSAEEHEKNTPRATGRSCLNKQPSSRREQIISRVRSSPSHTQFPQHSTNNCPVKKTPTLSNPPNSRSQEWQDRNLSVERKNNMSQRGSGISDKSKGSPFRHFNGRMNNGPDTGAVVAFLPQVQKTKGRVAESVDRVNRKVKNGNGLKGKHSIGQPQNV